MFDARDALAKAVENGGYKQSVVAERAGLTSQQFTDIIKKRRRLDANEMFRLCEVLKITPNDLFGIPPMRKQRRGILRKEAGT